MNHPEQEFWARLRKHIPGFTQRIESSTGNGIPDVFGCWKGKPYWMELKVWTPGVGVLLRKEQWAWCNLYTAHGGCCFVVTEVPMDKCILFMPIQAIRVKPYGTQEKYVVAESKVNSFDTILLRSKIIDPLTKFLFP